MYTPTPSGESRLPGQASLLPVSYRPAPLAQTGAETGWYVDDVRVQDAAPPLTPTCVTIRREEYGQVSDAYVWSAFPQGNLDFMELGT